MKPLVVFFALGALVHLARTQCVAAPTAPPSAEAPPLVVRVQPGQALDGAVDDALLVEVALARGAALTDPLIRDRLLTTSHAAGMDDPTRAIALGLLQADPIARQRLRFQGELALAAPVAASPEQVAAYLSAHAERYRGPERLDLEQVFVAHGGDVAGRAAELAEGRVRSDPSLLPRQARAATVGELSARFGDAVGEALRTAPLGVWQGPLRSPFGSHFVRVSARVPGTLPPPEQLQRRALADWQAESRAARLRERLVALRQGRRLVVERLDP